jgi:fermentation-respiration switch protein FrsA (DUF1100 family)
LIPVVMPLIGPLAFLCHQTWYSDRRMRQMAGGAEAPAFLFLSGTKDDLIPTPHFRILYDLCPSTQKRWKAFKEGTHSQSPFLSLSLSLSLSPSLSFPNHIGDRFCHPLALLDDTCLQKDYFPTMGSWIEEIYLGLKKS